MLIDIESRLNEDNAFRSQNTLTNTVWQNVVDFLPAAVPNDAPRPQPRPITLSIHVRHKIYECIPSGHYCCFCGCGELSFQ